MGQKTTIQKFDDITGEFREDVESVSFTLDGKAREIDLAPEGAAAFRDLFAPYFAASRAATVTAPRSSGGRKSSGGTSAPRPSANGGDPDKIRKQAARAWALAQGMDVPERGRLRADVVTQWEAAGSPMPDGSTAPAAPVAQADGRNDDERAAAAAVAGVPAPADANPDEIPTDGEQIAAAAGVPAAGSAEAEQQAATTDTGKRGRRGRAATTPQRPDASA